MIDDGLKIAEKRKEKYLFCNTLSQVQSIHIKEYA